MIHITESCLPDNQPNLIPDVAVAPNTTDDSVGLAGRIETMQERMPEKWKAEFDWAVCADCPVQEQCPIPGGQVAV